MSIIEEKEKRMKLYADTFVEGEETVSNEIVFKDIMESLTTATARLRDENAQRLLREVVQWVGRAPATDEEKIRVSQLREQASALLVNAA